MKRWLVSTTSTIALLMLGSGRSTAAPIAAITDSMLSGTVDRTDVIRDSLSLGTPTAPAFGGIVAVETGVSSRPTITDPSASTPSATFTYRAAVPVRGDAGLVGSVANPSRRNPGNVSNLKGTIGAEDAGVFSVPTSDIVVNGTPEQSYNYMYRPSVTVASALAPLDRMELIAREPFRDSPAHSVFIGVRSPVGDADRERAAREASIISATGSATPTVAISPLPGRPAASKGLEYQLDAGPATTIGFSTARLRPTTLGAGAAASSTLGYTYRPIGRWPVGQRPEPDPLLTTRPSDSAMLSATIAAPGGGAAHREPMDRRDGGRNGGIPPAVISTVSALRPLAPETVDTIPVDTFAIAAATPGGIGAGVDRLTIPILVRGELAGPGSGARSLLDTEAIEMGDGDNYTNYGLVAAAVLVPVGLAFMGFRIIRRAVLRRTV